MKKSYLVWSLSAAAIVAAASAGMAAEKPHRHGPSAEVKAAFQACASEIGVQKTEGERPRLSQEQREKMRACLESKGVKRPPHGHWGHHRNPEKFAKMKQCLEEAGVKMPEPGSGERPKFDDAAKAAMKACREKVRSEMKAGKQENSQVQKEE
jgi:hypothetical protein